MVVFSGGQDSTTCLGWALENYADVHAVSFNYGQKHSIELEAASRVLDYFEDQSDITIPHTVVDIEGIFLSSSPLTNENSELELYDNHDQMEQVIGDRVEKTFVPMRNAAFLMLAANRAIAAGCESLVTGVCQADNANYPDCRQIFIESAQMTINMALGTDNFRIDTPLMHLTKADTVALALSLPNTYEALAYSHTAYDGTYPPTSHDHASILRAHGFEVSGAPDPLVVRAVKEGLMEMPRSPNYYYQQNSAAWDRLKEAGIA